MGRTRRSIQVFTPVHVGAAAPEGTDLVQVAGRWFLLLWDEDNCIYSPAPETWLFTDGQLGPDCETEPYIPPFGFVRDLLIRMEDEINSGRLDQSAGGDE